MKIGVFAFMVDKTGELVDVETFTHFAASLKVDTVEYHLRKGFESHDKPFLLKIRRLCDKYGLPIGYLGSTGGFVGTDLELQTRVEQVKGDIDIAAVMVCTETGASPPIFT